MGAMKEIYTEAQHLIENPQNFWANWAQIEDYDNFVYAFCTAREDWGYPQRSSIPDLQNAYTLGGEGISENVSKLCDECATTLALTMNLTPIGGGDWANEEDMSLVWIKRVPVDTDTTSEIEACHCGNYLFARVPESALDGHFEDTGWQKQMKFDWIRQMAYLDYKTYGVNLLWLNPLTFGSGA